MDKGLLPETFTGQQTRQGRSKQERARRGLATNGLTDARGNALWHAQKADGSEDYRQELLNQSSIINRFEDEQKALGDTGKEKINSDIHSAFGQQGGSFASILGDDAFRKQVGNLSTAMKGYEGGDEMLAWQQKNNPMFEAQETFRQLQKTLMDIGVTLMPATLTTLKALDATLGPLGAAITGLVKAVSWFGGHNPLDLLFGGPKIQQQSFDGSTAGLLHRISGGDLGGGRLRYRRGVCDRRAISLSTKAHSQRRRRWRRRLPDRRIRS